MSRYLEACADLEFGRFDEIPMIAADLELTGLDKSSDRIIAMGWTLIDRGRIRMDGNRHLLINADRSVGSSAAIHELLDSDVAAGIDLNAGLASLFEAARGRLWILHHAGIDVGFLKRACARWSGVKPGFIVLDIMRIEYRLRRRRDVAIKQGDLQLGSIRERYGLPRYTAHNALTDALATAELMMAVAASMEPDGALDVAPHIKFF